MFESISNSISSRASAFTQALSPAALLRAAFPMTSKMVGAAMEVMPSFKSEKSSTAVKGTADLVDSVDEGNDIDLEGFEELAEVMKEGFDETNEHLIEIAALLDKEDEDDQEIIEGLHSIVKAVEGDQLQKKEDALEAKFSQDKMIGVLSEIGGGGGPLEQKKNTFLDHFVVDIHGAIGGLLKRLPLILLGWLPALGVAITAGFLTLSNDVNAAVQKIPQLFEEGLSFVADKLMLAVDGIKEGVGFLLEKGQEGLDLIKEKAGEVGSFLLEKKDQAVAKVKEVGAGASKLIGDVSKFVMETSPTGQAITGAMNVSSVLGKSETEVTVQDRIAGAVGGLLGTSAQLVDMAAGIAGYETNFGEEVRLKATRILASPINSNIEPTKQGVLRGLKDNLSEMNFKTITEKEIRRGQPIVVQQNNNSVQSGSDSPAPMSTPVPRVRNQEPTIDRVFESNFTPYFAR